LGHWRLAVTTLFVVIRTGMSEIGVLGFWKSLVPHMDVPGWMAIFMIPMIWVLEFVG